MLAIPTTLTEESLKRMFMAASMADRSGLVGILAQSVKLSILTGGKLPRSKLPLRWGEAEADLLPKS